MTIPLPNASAVARLLTDLVGRDVAAKSASPTPLQPAALSIAEYRDEGGALRAVACCDLPVGASFGAAMTVMPPAQVDESVRNRRLDATIAENLAEVFNVLAAIFPKSGGPRLVLRGVHHGADTAAEVEAALAKPGKRLDLDVSVATYKSGRMTILVV